MLIGNKLAQWLHEMNSLEELFVDIYQEDAPNIIALHLEYRDFQADGLYDNNNPEYIYITTSSLCKEKPVSGTHAYRDATYVIGEALRAGAKTGICFYGLAVGTRPFLNQFPEIRWHFTLENCGDFYTGGHDPYHFNTEEKEYVHI